VTLCNPIAPTRSTKEPVFTGGATIHFSIVTNAAEWEGAPQNFITDGKDNEKTSQPIAQGNPRL
jgi:hypothetical protein